MPQQEQSSNRPLCGVRGNRIAPDPLSLFHVTGGNKTRLCPSDDRRLLGLQPRKPASACMRTLHFLDLLHKRLHLPGVRVFVRLPHQSLDINDVLLAQLSLTNMQPAKLEAGGTVAGRTVSLFISFFPSSSYARAKSYLYSTSISASYASQRLCMWDHGALYASRATWVGGGPSWQRKGRRRRSRRRTWLSRSRRTVESGEGAFVGGDCGLVW
jgi:hypothetical protein